MILFPAWPPVVLPDPSRPAGRSGHRSAQLAWWCPGSGRGLGLARRCRRLRCRRSPFDRRPAGVGVVLGALGVAAAAQSEQPLGDEQVDDNRHVDDERNHLQRGDALGQLIDFIRDEHDRGDKRQVLRPPAPVPQPNRVGTLDSRVYSDRDADEIQVGDADSEQPRRSCTMPWLVALTGPPRPPCRSRRIREKSEFSAALLLANKNDWRRPAPTAPGSESAGRWRSAARYSARAVAGRAAAG